MCSQQSKGAKYPQKSFNCADAFSIKITRFHAALKPIFRSLKPFQAFSSLLNLGARDFSFYMNTHIRILRDTILSIMQSTILTEKISLHPSMPLTISTMHRTLMILRLHSAYTTDIRTDADGSSAPESKTERNTHYDC